MANGGGNLSLPENPRLRGNAPLMFGNLKSSRWKTGADAEARPWKARARLYAQRGIIHASGLRHRISTPKQKGPSMILARISWTIYNLALKQAGT